MNLDVIIKPEHNQRRELIMTAQLPSGGWTREQLAAWLVPWPAPIGWREQLIIYGFPYRPPPS